MASLCRVSFVRTLSETVLDSSLEGSTVVNYFCAPTEIMLTATVPFKVLTSH
jgi:hypothetical protein